MKLSKSKYFFLALSYVMVLSSCSGRNNAPASDETSIGEEYAIQLLKVGAEPWALYYDGTYYYTHGCGDRIVIWRTDDILRLEQAESKTVWIPGEESNSQNLWGPEIHNIDGKWYVYFAADDGNTDNHRIYVIENESRDPFEGEFVMKGKIKTDPDDNWAIHATVFEHSERLYMAWSGWQTPRIDAETQCIYIAEMENPWTLKSDRVLLSMPDLEWERQWINPDGTRTAYSIYVNEGPQAFSSRDGDRILLYYNASGNWSPYYAIGLLSADSGSDLLDPGNWHKAQEPVFSHSEANGVFSPGNIAFLPSADSSEMYFIYHGRHIPNQAPCTPRLQKLKWTDRGMPVLGTPLPLHTVEQAEE